jgi:excisionase family DNA binding protein
MGLSIRSRKALSIMIAERHERHRAAFREAKEAEARWRQEMMPAKLVAATLGISRETLRRWVNSGRISPAVKMGDSQQSHVRFRRSDVERLLAERLGEPPPAR